MEHFRLRWNNFHKNMIYGFRALLQEDSLVDVTLAADGHFVQAHRLVLSVCSPYFKELFSVNPCNHPIVILKDVKCKQLTDILSFIYQGEVSVRQEDLPDFLKTAELLQIRGLAEQRASKNRHNKIDKSTSCKINELGRPTEVQAVGQGTRGKVQSLSRLNPVLEAVTSEESTSLEDSNAGVTIEGVSTVTASTSTSSTKQVHIREHSSPPILMRIPIKQEIPDIPSDFEQDANAAVTDELIPTEVDKNQEELGVDHVVLQRMDQDELRGLDNNLWNSQSANEGSCTSGAAASRIKDMKSLNGDNPILLKKTNRKQRMIALNKIRRFLVTPKRSRRIARRMRRRKDLIVKSARNADLVNDISRSLPVIGKHAVNIMTNTSDSVTKENSSLPEKKDSELVLPLSRPEGKVENDVAPLGNGLVSMVSRAKKNKRKRIPGVSFSGSRSNKKRRRVRKKNVCESSFKAESALSYEKVSIVEDNSGPSEDKLFTNSDKQNLPVVMEETNRNKSAVLNKKKMIVFIAAKKTKSAVALARKTKSNLTLSEKTNSPEVLSYQNDASAAMQVHSPIRGQISKPVLQNEDGFEKSISSTILRSSVPNSAVTVNTTGQNGEACRHVGCVGCREGN